MTLGKSHNISNLEMWVTPHLSHCKRLLGSFKINIDENPWETNYTYTNKYGLLYLSLTQKVAYYKDGFVNCFFYT